MKGVAQTFPGSTVEKTAITVPTYFNDSQRQSTKDAAGLEVLRMINEPTVAAIAYALDKRASTDGKRNVLVFDLGGGTFDVSLLTIDKGGVIKIKATGGDTHLGGENFDNRMLRVHCERAKRIISTAILTTIDIDCLFNGVDFSAKFTHAKFEEVNMDLFKKCIKTAKTCLKDENMDKENIDEVVLFGGSTRIPKRIIPDEAVAYDAGYLATNLSDLSDEVVRGLKLIVVTPLSLDDYQTAGLVMVYQGERLRSSKNYLLGQLSLSGLPSAPRGGIEIKICYEIDDNRILHASARELTTSRNKAIKITNGGGLSKAEIAKMIKDAKRYKQEDEAHIKKAMAHKALND
ncbi:Heat shock protein 70, conserved site-containing protein [Cynara cardunculus var. scolymus]|uniref:Heat shock protein 70, conserved site-containing protein n=1 Tax=Cynara cardunculus var. scolymus TaxID=59895 RepID=A0A103XV13_CYNCS|nr:Heat shock protein 70, conserved site-containing protein [Cynara cardunculus var. scolymus]